VVNTIARRMRVPKTILDNDDQRGEAKIDRTFWISDPLYFFFFTFCSFMCATCGVLARPGATFSPPRTAGRVVSPFIDWSDDSLGEVMDTADCFDFNDGLNVDTAVLDRVNPELDVRVDDEKLELFCLLDILAFEEKEDGGVFENGFCFRKLSPGVRPRACFSEGEGDSIAPEATVLGVFDIPEAVRVVCREGVDFLKTASLYRSTTPRANKLVALAPFRSSSTPASTKSQSSSSSSRSVAL